MSRLSLVSQLKSSIVEIVDTVFPNRVLASCCAVGFTLETTLHTLATTSIFREGYIIASFAVVVMLWIWVSLAWVGLWSPLEFPIESETNTTIVLKRCFRFSQRLAFSFALVAVTGSWLLQSQIGRFATLDAFLFLWTNPLLSMWDHLGHGERTAIIGVAVASPVLIGFFVMLLRMTPAQHVTEVRATNWRASWLLCGLCVLIAWQPDFVVT